MDAFIFQVKYYCLFLKNVILVQMRDISPYLRKFSEKKMLVLKNFLVLKFQDPYKQWYITSIITYKLKIINFVYVTLNRGGKYLCLIRPN